MGGNVPAHSVASTDVVLFLATLFVVLVAVFGMFLAFARPENIERPFMVGAMTTATASVSGWLLWLQWHSFVSSTGSVVAFALVSLTGFGFGRAIDAAMGPRRLSADERQATLGADLAD